MRQLELVPDQKRAAFEEFHAENRHVSIFRQTRPFNCIETDG